MENTVANERNIQIYPLYKAFAWDMFFYYSIAFLFLTQVKNLSPSEVLLTEAAYPIFKMLLLIPFTKFIEKQGKRKSLIFANISIVLSISILIFAQNIWYVFAFQLFSSLGYLIKGICETNMLYDSIPRNPKRGSLFAKIDGKATSYYYYINSVASFAAGFLYVINPYIPMVLCLIMSVIATLLCFKFKEIDDERNEVKENHKENTKGLLKDILKSPRLINLISFGALFYGLLAILTTLRTSLLDEIRLPEQYFGVIFALLEIISGITTMNQNKFHNKLKNRTLAVLSIPVTVSCIILGVVAKSNIPFMFVIVILILLYIIQYVMKGPFYILIKRYLNNFTTHKIRNKISSVYNLVENISRCIIALISSILLKYTTTANTLLIIGTIYTILLLAMLINMKGKVGLNPEEYTEKDIKFLNLK